MEFLLELVFELLLNIVGEAALELTVRTRAGLLTMFGAILGAVSALAFPHPFIHDAALRWANVALAPLVVGGMACLLARLRGQAAARMTLRAACFAFAFALTRLLVSDALG